jgi:hypothetical protein
MINKLVKIYSTLLVSLLSISGLSMAEGTYQTYEIGESDQLVFFKMSAEEIALEDAVLARAELMKNSWNNKAEKWVETIELPESGMVLEFPMSKRQIRLAKAKAEMTLLNAKDQIESTDKGPCHIAETVEMGDGSTVVFYTPVVDKNDIDSHSLSDYVTMTC